MRLIRTPFWAGFALSFFIIFPGAAQAQYQLQGLYLQSPDSVIPHLLRSADFWKASIDSTDGGFYTEVNQDGTPERTDRKSFTQCSRHAYGFSRAFMVSGDTRYLDYAEHAIQFVYDHGWDQTHLGWYFSSDKFGTPAPPYGGGWNPNEDKWSFQQHYSVLGIGAMAEATRAPLHLNWLEESARVNDSLLWDNRPGFEGYYQTADGDWSNKRNKGFTATVDAVTTWVLAKALITDSQEDIDRLLAVADNIVNHLYASMSVSSVQFGFAEEYTSNWVLKSNSNGGSTGHVIKTAWCLARAYMYDPKPVYRQAAQEMIDDMMYNGGYDYTNGGLYTSYNWSTGAVTQEKDYWMLEQGVTSGLINYFLATDPTDRELNLGMADGCMDFFMTHFVDPVYGEIYSQTNASGGVINNDKSDPFKGGYHNIELAYLTYVYGKLFIHEEPITLYYKFEPVSEARQFKMNPLAIRDDLLEINVASLDGVPYTDFDASGRLLNIPAGTGGVFALTYNLTGPFVSNKDQLAKLDIQLYPNPTSDQLFIAGLEQAATVRVINMAGQALLVENIRPGASLSVQGLPTGAYILEINTTQARSHVRFLKH